MKTSTNQTTSKLWGALKSLLNSQTFLGLIQDALLKLLKAQAMGGFRGWLIKTLVREFSEEVIEVATDVIDFIEIKHIARDTINETDRNVATDRLNDILR